jgi:hypothetical protein
MPRKSTINGHQFWDADKYDFWDLPIKYADDLTRQFLEAFSIPYTNEDALNGDLHKISDLISLCIQSMKKDYFSKDSIMRKEDRLDEFGEIENPVETIRTIRITEQAKPLPRMGWVKGEKNYSFFKNDEEMLWVNPQEHEDKDKMPVNPYSYSIPDEGSHIGWGLATAPAYHLSSRIGGIKLSALDSPEKRRNWMAQFDDQLRFNGVEVTVGIPQIEEIEEGGIRFSKTSSVDHDFKGIFENLRDVNWRQSDYLLKDPTAPFPFTGTFKAYTKKTSGSQGFQINDAKNWKDFVSQVDNQLEAGDDISFSTDNVFNRHMKSRPYGIRTNDNIFDTQKTYENMGELSKIRFFKDYEVDKKSGSSGKIGGVGYQFVSTNDNIKLIHKNPMSVTLSKDEKTDKYIFDRALWGVHIPFNSSSLYKKLFDDKFNEWKENLIQRIDKAKLTGNDVYWKKSELTKKNFVKFDNPTPPTRCLKLWFYVFRQDDYVFTGNEDTLMLSVFASYDESGVQLDPSGQGKPFSHGGDRGDPTWFMKHRRFSESRYNADGKLVRTSGVEQGDHIDEDFSRPDPYKALFWLQDKEATKRMYDIDFDAKSYVVVPPMKDYGIINF